MKKELIYVLKNPSFDGWIKIGRTDDLTKRLNDLNSKTAVPLPFRIFATLETNDSATIEQEIHNLIDNINPSLRALEALSDGSTRKREFFKITDSVVINVLISIAKIANIFNQLTFFGPSEQDIKIDNAINEPKKSAFSFEKLGIPIGSVLTFVNDSKITCTTVDTGRSVKDDNGEVTYLSPLAAKLLGVTNSPQGPKYFMFQGETLSDRRDRLENLSENS